MKFWTIAKKSDDNAPSILLKQAAFLIKLGMPRAVLVLYDWTLTLAPKNTIALAGLAEARRLATETDTARYWKQIVGKPMVKA